MVIRTSSSSNRHHHRQHSAGVSAAPSAHQQHQMLFLPAVPPPPPPPQAMPLSPEQQYHYQSVSPVVPPPPQHPHQQHQHQHPQASPRHAAFYPHQQHHQHHPAAPLSPGIMRGQHHQPQQQPQHHTQPQMSPFHLPYHHRRNSSLSSTISVIETETGSSNPAMTQQGLLYSPIQTSNKTSKQYQQQQQQQQQPPQLAQQVYPQPHHHQQHQQQQHHVHPLLQSPPHQNKSAHPLLRPSPQPRHRRGPPPAPFFPPSPDHTNVHANNNHHGSSSSLPQVSFDDKATVTHEYHLDPSVDAERELWYTTKELQVLKAFAREDARPMTTSGNHPDDEEDIEVSLGSDYRLVIQTLWEDCQQFAAIEQLPPPNRHHHRRSASAPLPLDHMKQHQEFLRPDRHAHYVAWVQQATPEFLGLERYLKRLRRDKQDNLARMRKHMRSVGQYTDKQEKQSTMDDVTNHQKHGRRRHKRCVSYNDYAYHFHRQAAAQESIAKYCQKLSLPSRLLAQSMGALLANQEQREEQGQEEDEEEEEEVMPTVSLTSCSSSSFNNQGQEMAWSSDEEEEGPSDEDSTR